MTLTTWKMMKTQFFKSVFTFLLLAFVSSQTLAAYLLIPMDDSQKNHLKAYGIAYWVLQSEVEVDWLLNYRGGSFMCKYAKQIENECTIRGVSFEIIADAQSTAILQEIANPEVNMDIAKLEKVPTMLSHWYLRTQKYRMMSSTMMRYWMESYYSTIGFTFIMKISRDNMADSGATIETFHGIRSRSSTRKKWPEETGSTRFLN